MTFDLGLILSYLPELALAAATTFGIWIVGSLAAALLGFAIALARWWGGLILGAPLLLFVEMIRGTPFLVQLFLLYFGGPFIGISLEPASAGLLGLAVYGSAYFSEIFRAGLSAVPRGHVESAECLGFTRPQVIRRILLPEMTMLVLPPSVNLLIVLIKETAVLSIITVPELTLVITGIGSKYYAFAEALFLLALFYWGLVELAGRLGRLAETRLAKYSFAR